MDQRGARIRPAEQGHARPAGDLEEAQRLAITRAVDRGWSQHRGACAHRVECRGFAGTLAGGVVRERRFARGQAGDQQEMGAGRQPLRHLRDPRDALLVHCQEIGTPCRLDEPGQMDHRVGALHQTGQRRLIVERPGHHLRRRLPPFGAGRLAAQQQPHAPPDCTSAATRCRPMKPVAPVTATRGARAG